MIPFYLYTDMPKLSEHKVIAQIDTNALTDNYKLLCSMTEGTRHICVVKADAYGHTAEICVPALLDAGCRFFAVSCVEEAISVRKICEEQNVRASVLILGYTDCRQAGVLAENDIIQTILSTDYARELDEQARMNNCRVRTHVALDTGMNRIGLCAHNQEECDAAISDIEEISKLGGIILEGMFTHFAKSDEDDENDPKWQNSLTYIQTKRFLTVRRGLESKGIKLFCHACNSAAAIRFPSLAFDGVRFGILLYGVQPSRNISVPVKPVMSLKTIISHVHTLIPGETVSYGGKYSSDEERTIATLPIGYADGFMRAYSGFEMTVNTDKGDLKARVIGRICMDQCMIDVTGLPVNVGDAVTVFGTDPSQLSYLADLAGTIEYECLCLVSARVPRIKKADNNTGGKKNEI